MADYLISILIGYFVGSFPSAYLFVKLKVQRDIRNEGTGKVGTMNALEVSKSKTVGIGVLVVDVLKGILPILFVSNFIGGEFWLSASAGIAAIVGHDFPVWLKFKGGRGLATTAGVMLIFGWIFIVIWLLWFAMTYLVFKKLHLGNIVATVLSLISIAVVPKNILETLLPRFSEVHNYLYLGIIICSLILIRHIDSILELVKIKQS